MTSNRVAHLLGRGAGNAYLRHVHRRILFWALVFLTGFFSISVLESVCCSSFAFAGAGYAIYMCDVILILLIVGAVARRAIYSASQPEDANNHSCKNQADSFRCIARLTPPNLSGFPLDAMCTVLSLKLLARPLVAGEGNFDGVGFPQLVGKGLLIGFLTKMSPRYIHSGLRPVERAFSLGKTGRAGRFRSFANGASAFGGGSGGSPVLFPFGASDFGSEAYATEAFVRILRSAENVFSDRGEGLSVRPRADSKELLSVRLSNAHSAAYQDEGRVRH